MKTSKLQPIATLMAASAVFSLSPMGWGQDVYPIEARAIAKQSFIYGYPLVDSYRIL